MTLGGYRRRFQGLGCTEYGSGSERLTGALRVIVDVVGISGQGQQDGQEQGTACRDSQGLSGAGQVDGLTAGQRVLSGSRSAGLAGTTKSPLKDSHSPCVVTVSPVVLNHHS